MKFKTLYVIILFPVALALSILGYYLLVPQYKYQISVIMPAYNSEQYIEESIESILTQSFKDFQLIIVNDASTDKTQQIAERFAKKDSRIKLINLPQNSGAASARNEGIKHIEGKYTIFVDSDDWLLTNMLEELYNHSEKYNLDMNICQAHIFDNEKQELTREGSYVNENSFLQYTYLKGKNLTVFSYKNIPTNFFQISLKYTWNKLIKSSIIKKNNLQFDNVKKHNDSYFITMAMLHAKRIGYIPNRLYVYRINRKNAISDIHKKEYQSVYQTFKKIKESLIEMDLYKTLYKSYNKWLYDFIPEHEFEGINEEYRQKMIELFD